jgi:hypothetical protein
MSQWTPLRKWECTICYRRFWAAAPFSELPGEGRLSESDS